MNRPTLHFALLAALALAACEPNNQGYAPEQPIAYSHALHAGALQIPCLYCHFGAERSRHAGIPPAQVCMNCHKLVLPKSPEVKKIADAIDYNDPIKWIRVHRLPDHAYFNHDIHVAKGLACQTCHGPVQEMGTLEQWAPLNMGWCLDCHRRGGKPVVPGEPTPPRVDTYLTDCSVCHH